MGHDGEEVSSAVPEMEGEFGASMDLDDYGFRMAIAPSFSFPTSDAKPLVESIDLLMYDKDLDAVVVEQWGESIRYDEEQHKLSVYVGDISTFF